MLAPKNNKNNPKKSVFLEYQKPGASSFIWYKSLKLENINEIASAFAGEIVKINGALPEGDFLYEKYKQVIDEFSE